MYFNGTDYYFFSGVKSVFRNMLHDDDIDNKDIIFVLKTKNFPFRSISRSINGKEKVIGIYNKAVINSYFSTKEKCEEIKRIIDYSSEDEIQKIIAELPKKTAPSSTQTKNENKEKMIAYLDRSPEEDMDYVSKQLLIDDDIIYESQGIINDKLYEFAEYIFNECKYYVENADYDEYDDISFSLSNDVCDEYLELYKIKVKQFNVKFTDNIYKECAAVTLDDDPENINIINLKIKPSLLEHKNKCISMIMHELTHIVNFYANIEKGDKPINRYEKTRINVKYDSENKKNDAEYNELINDMYYYFNKSEMNARISETYYYLLHDKSTQEYLSDVNNKNIHEKIEILFSNIADRVYIYDMEDIIKHIYNDNILYEFDDNYDENSGLTAMYEKYKKEASLLSKLKIGGKKYNNTLSSYIKRKLDLVSYLQNILDDFKKRIYRMLYKLIEDIKDKKYINESENLSDVETEWKPKEGLFLSKSPRGIANYLLKHSKDKSQAMKRLTFYMNRAGENLTNKTVLNKVKELLKSKD